LISLIIALDRVHKRPSGARLQFTPALQVTLVDDLRGQCQIVRATRRHEALSICIVAGPYVASHGDTRLFTGDRNKRSLPHEQDTNIRCERGRFSRDLDADRSTQDRSDRLRARARQWFVGCQQQNGT
jgi:hypothetical protein